MTDRTTRVTAAVTVALVAALAASAVLVAPAAAGDNVAVYEFEPNDAEVEPGEELAVEVVFSSHGGYGGEGVADLAVAVGYDEAVLSVVDVEAGTWLAGENADDGDDALEDGDVETTVETDEGTVRVEQARESTEDAVTGTAPVATITFEVDAEADPGETALEFEETAANTTAYPQNTIERSGTIEVVDTSADDTVPGVGVVGALAALAAASLVAALAARTR